MGKDKKSVVWTILVLLLAIVVLDAGKTKNLSGRVVDADSTQKIAPACSLDVSFSDWLFKKMTGINKQTSTRYISAIDAISGGAIRRYFEIEVTNRLINYVILDTYFYDIGPDGAIGTNDDFSKIVSSSDSSRGGGNFNFIKVAGSLIPTEIYYLESMPPDYNIDIFKCSLPFCNSKTPVLTLSFTNWGNLGSLSSGRYLNSRILIDETKNKIYLTSESPSSSSVDILSCDMNNVGQNGCALGENGLKKYVTALLPATKGFETFGFVGIVTYSTPNEWLFDIQNEIFTSLQGQGSFTNQYNSYSVCSLPAFGLLFGQRKISSNMIEIANIDLRTKNMINTENFQISGLSSVYDIIDCGFNPQTSRFYTIFDIIDNSGRSKTIYKELKNPNTQLLLNEDSQYDKVLHLISNKQILQDRGSLLRCN